MSKERAAMEKLAVSLGKSNVYKRYEREWVLEKVGRWIYKFSTAVKIHYILIIAFYKSFAQIP